MQILWYSPSCQRRRPPQAREQLCQRIRRHPREVQILLGLPLRVQAVIRWQAGRSLLERLREVDAALITPGRRWPLGPVGMGFLERLRVVGASFVVFDLDLDNAALPPLSGDPNDVQDTLAMRVPWVVLPETPVSMYEGR